MASCWSASGSSYCWIPDTPFLELSPLAAWGTEFAVGGSVVTGIGVVEGTECLISASDPTVRGGTSNPWTVRKSFRAHDIALANRLPVISLVESGGADLPTQKEIFIPGGRTFRDLTRLSAAGIPTIAIVFGNSTAGGAYLPGMSDHVVMISERSKVFLGGPPLVKMATGEESDDESLGGAEMHARTSGLADYLAADEQDAIRIGRRIVARLNWRKQGPAPAAKPAPPLFDDEQLVGIVPPDLRIPFDPREVIARVVDGSDFDEFKPSYGTSLVTGWASVHGYPVGILANAQGVLFSAESQKAAQFIQLANQVDTPLIFLHNTTGYMVGSQYEQAGIIKHGAMMINAVSNSAVPHISILLGASYGAGHYGMCGRAYDPRFLFAWPSAKSAVMGPAQLAGVLSIVSQGGGAGGRPAVRRGRGRGDEGDGGSADRGRVAADVPVRPDLRRRHHRPARHPHRARPVPVGHPRGAGPRRHRLRRLPDVTRDAPSACDWMYGLGVASTSTSPERRRRPLPSASSVGVPSAGAVMLTGCWSRTAARSRAGSSAPAETSASPPSPSTPTPTPARRTSPTPTSPSGCRARRPPTPTCALTCSIEAALRAGADAVHPGYGFLSENAAFARAVQEAGLTWIGPPPAAIEAMGSKVEAKRLMAAAGVPVLPELAPGSLTEADLPVLIKASAGGGGRGMRIVRTLARAASRARGGPVRGGVGVRRPGGLLRAYIESGRHIEVQILADDSRHDLDRRRARVLDPAPAPEDHRGSAVAPRAAAAWHARAAVRGGAGRRQPRSATAAPARPSSSPTRTAGSTSWR